MDNNNFEDRKKRAQKIVSILKKMYPSTKTELNYKTNLELLVAVILSAQCTDKRVNEVTKDLFKKYKKIEDYINANPKEFELEIKSTGFFRNKTKSILGAARTVQNNFGGKIPKTMEEMLTIPGVARKTANVVLAGAHNVYEGIAVDTHVRRLALKFELTESKNPVIIERHLMELIKEKDWKWVNHSMVMYGRYICKANKHECEGHPLTRIYPKAATIWPKSR